MGLGPRPETDGFIERFLLNGLAPVNRALPMERSLPSNVIDTFEFGLSTTRSGGNSENAFADAGALGRALGSAWSPCPSGPGVSPNVEPRVSGSPASRLVPSGPLVRAVVPQGCCPRIGLFELPTFSPLG